MGESDKSSDPTMLVLVVLLIALLIGGGFLFYQRQRAAMQQAAEAELRQLEVDKRAREEALRRKAEIEQDQLQGSFVITTSNGVRYRITPEFAKLQELSPSVGVALEQEFQGIVTKRVLSESEGGAVVDVANVVFASIIEKDESGQCLPPIEFKVRDYASVEKLK